MAGEGERERDGATYSFSGCKVSRGAHADRWIGRGSYIVTQCINSLVACIVSKLTVAQRSGPCIHPNKLPTAFFYLWKLDAGQSRPAHSHLSSSDIF